MSSGRRYRSVAEIPITKPKYREPPASQLSSPSSSQRTNDTSRIEEDPEAQIADVRFLALEDHAPEDLQDLQFAYQKLAKRDVEGMRWVQEKDLRQLADSASRDAVRVVYVVQPFSGRAFDFLSLKKCSIYGPQCLVSCVEKQLQLPRIKHGPVINIAMYGVEICCTGLSTEKRTELFKKVALMGGRFQKEFREDVTHLIALETGSKKYLVAAENGIPVIGPEWVEEIWRLSLSGEVDCNTEERLKKHHVPMFKGKVITLSQVPPEQRRAFKTEIQKYGGGYRNDLSPKQTTHLICNEAIGDKYEAALKWKLVIVSPKWMVDSVRKGYCLDCEKYLVKPMEAPGPPPTPKHVKQGRNGTRATSTPNKGAKCLDATLDISHVGEEEARARSLLLPIVENEEVDFQHICEAELIRPTAKLPRPCSNEGNTNGATTYAANSQVSISGAVAERVFGLQLSSVPPRNPEPQVIPSSEEEKPGPSFEIDPPSVDSGADEWMANMVMPEVEAETEKIKEIPVTTVAQRILNLLPDLSTQTSIPVAKEVFPKKDQMFNALRRDKIPVPIPRGLKRTAPQKSPVHKRGIVVWSQAERIPFAARKTGEDDAAGDSHMDIDNADLYENGKDPVPVPPQPPESKKPKKQLSLEILAPSVVTARNSKPSISHQHTSPEIPMTSTKKQPSVVTLSDDDDACVAALEKAEKEEQHVKGKIQKPVHQEKLDPARKQVQLEKIVQQAKVEPTRKPTQPEVMETTDPNRIFMISGVSIESEKKGLFDAIRKLGATFIDSIQYEAKATHLITKNPTKNEKFLAAIAAGKWVLHTKYLEDSVAAGHFLPECMYEWGNFEHAESVMGQMEKGAKKLAISAYKWRVQVEKSRQKAFENWRVVLVADNSRRDGYVRLLEAGGAKILTTSSQVVMDYVNDATHLLHEPSKVPIPKNQIEAFQEAGVSCQRADFLSPFLTDTEPGTFQMDRNKLSSSGSTAIKVISKSMVSATKPVKTRRSVDALEVEHPPVEKAPKRSRR